MSHPSAAVASRFWAKVTTAGPDDCWLWTAKSTNGVYGLFAGNRWRYAAHRYAFWLAYGRWPNVCRHSCDTPLCCNPAHLLDGTVADNNHDTAVRRRHRAHTDPVYRAQLVTHFKRGPRPLP